MIREEFIKGAFEYKIEHYGKKEHSGIFHQMFCHQHDEQTITYGNEFTWSKKVIEYPCGYLKVVHRNIKDKK